MREKKWTVLRDSSFNCGYKSSGKKVLWRFKKFGLYCGLFSSASVDGIASWKSHRSTRQPAPLACRNSRRTKLYTQQLFASAWICSMNDVSYWMSNNFANDVLINHTNCPVLIIILNRFVQRNVIQRQIYLTSIKTDNRQFKLPKACIEIESTHICCPIKISALESSVVTSRWNYIASSAFFSMLHGIDNAGYPCRLKIIVQLPFIAWL